MLKQQLQQTLRQKLTPQQIRFISLLELPAAEMEEQIKWELEDNPALEESSDIDNLPPPNDTEDNDNASDEIIADNDTPDSTDPLLSDNDFPDTSDDDLPNYKLYQPHDNSQTKHEFLPASSTSLYESLLQQIRLHNLSDNDLLIAEYIIGNIDSDGYLRRDNNALADDLAIQTKIVATNDHIESLIRTLQSCDPPGVAARNLRECLLLQIQRRPDTTNNTLAANILNNYFDDFARKRYNKILQALNINQTTLKEAIAAITALNPKPAANLFESAIESSLNAITPDFIVDIRNGQPVLEMNHQTLPPLRIGSHFKDMLHNYQHTAPHSRTADQRNALLFAKQKIQAAQWFIYAVKQRHLTLQRTMTAIILLQKDFFLSGDETQLQPMRLKDIAQLTGYDLSTISRVTHRKYVETQFGTFPLRFFFSDATTTHAGETISNKKVKTILQQLIRDENPNNPLSDQRLAQTLTAKGFRIARRTIAKYREQLNLPTARLRKHL